MFDLPRWESRWERDHEAHQQDIADALDAPSRMLIWLMPVLAFWMAVPIAIALWIF